MTLCLSLPSSGSQFSFIFFCQAEDGIRCGHVTGVQTCALPICNFGTTMGNHVEAFAGKLGYALVQRIPYSLKSPDFTAELSKIKASKPDLLVISGYYGDSKIIAETAAKLRIGVHALVGLANAA